MRIIFDQGKRERTLRERGLDFLDAVAVFADTHFTFENRRFDYPEVRYVTIGLLAGRMIVLVWTPDPDFLDDGSRRVISMRKANAREQARFRQRLGQIGQNDG